MEIGPRPKTPLSIQPSKAAEFGNLIEAYWSTNAIETDFKLSFRLHNIFEALLAEVRCGKNHAEQTLHLANS